jgi:hypothetical protein
MIRTRFSDDPEFAHLDPKDRGDLFASETQRRLDLRSISLTTIQACIMLGAFSMTEGEAEAESVYYSAASRMAHILDLPNRPVADALEKELNLRST